MGSHGSGFRTFENVYINGRRTQRVKSWIDKRCFVCGKFINKRNSKYCDKHNTRKETMDRFFSKKRGNLIHLGKSKFGNRYEKKENFKVEI